MVECSQNLKHFTGARVVERSQNLKHFIGALTG